MIKSCFGCEERHIGCHSGCERYEADLAKHIDDAKRRKAAIHHDLKISDVQYNGLRTIKKK